MTSQSMAVRNLAERLGVFDNVDLVEELGENAKGVASTLIQRKQLIAVSYGVFGKIGATENSPEYKDWLERFRARRDAMADPPHNLPSAKLIRFLREDGGRHRAVDIKTHIGCEVHNITATYVKRGVLIKHEDGTFSYNEAGDRPMPAATIASKPMAEAWSDDHSRCVEYLGHRAATSAEMSSILGIVPQRIASVMTRLVTDGKAVRYPCLSGKQHFFYGLVDWTAFFGPASTEQTFLMMAAHCEPTSVVELEKHKLGDTTATVQQIVASGYLRFEADKTLKITPSGMAKIGISEPFRFHPALLRPRSLAILEALYSHGLLTSPELALHTGESQHPMMQFIKNVLQPAGGVHTVADRRPKRITVSEDGIAALKFLQK